MNSEQPSFQTLNYEILLLDAHNPRLPESIRGTNDQEKILEFMKSAFELEELALSITKNGYFLAEPLVVIPAESASTSNGNYIVVEGNRRLATIKGLLTGKFAGIGVEADNGLRAQFKELPVVIYKDRSQVISFVGVHHLAGVRKWDVYQRAEYIVKLKREQNLPIKEIQNIIGDRKNSAKKTYVCYTLIELIEKYDETFSTNDAKTNFSLLNLATGQMPIREYIGLASWNDISDVDNSIPREKYDKLRSLFAYLFDNNDKKRLIQESRDITGKLAPILKDQYATRILEDNQDIDEAYDMVGGKWNAINKKLDNAKKILKSVNGELSGEDLKNTSTDPVKENVTEIISIIKRIVDEISKRFNK